MQLGYIPFYTKNVDEIVWLNDAFNDLLFRMRQKWGFDRWSQRKWLHDRFQPISCQQCQSTYRVECHHIRPVWSWAAELLLYERPICRGDVLSLMQRIRQKEFDYVNLFAHRDLQPLCIACHSGVGKRADQMWQQKLSNEYPVLWKLRYTTKDFHGLVNHWYAQ